MMSPKEFAKLTPWQRWQRRNPDKAKRMAREGARRYRARHPERNAEACKRWRDAHPDHPRADQRTKVGKRVAWSAKHSQAVITGLQYRKRAKHSVRHGQLTNAWRAKSG